MWAQLKDCIIDEEVGKYREAPLSPHLRYGDYMVCHPHFPVPLPPCSESNSQQRKALTSQEARKPKGSFLRREKGNVFEFVLTEILETSSSSTS